TLPGDTSSGRRMVGKIADARIADSECSDPQYSASLPVTQRVPLASEVQSLDTLGAQVLSRFPNQPHQDQVELRSNLLNPGTLAQKSYRHLLVSIYAVRRASTCSRKQSFHRRDDQKDSSRRSFCES